MVAHDEWRHKLRVAIARRDAAAITQLLHDELPEDGLQHAGDAVLCALAIDPDPARTVGSSVADALRARFWDGDTELADAIDTALGRRTDTLTPIAVDLDFLTDALTEPLGSIGYLDLHTGTVITEASLDYSDDEDDIEDRSRWLPVPGEGSDEPYRDMRHFVATVTDSRLAQQLDHAIEGRGAFRRFYDVIATNPAEHTRWQRYSDDARLGRARSWLGDHGYRPNQPTGILDQDSK